MSPRGERQGGDGEREKESSWLLWCLCQSEVEERACVNKNALYAYDKDKNRKVQTYKSCKYCLCVVCEGGTLQVHAADTDTVRVMCRCLSRHRSLNFCTLNSFKLCTHQWMCTSSYTQAFPFFLLLSWVCLYWFSCVQWRRCGGRTTYKVYSLDVMREYGRHGEPCNWSQDCVKHACIGRQRLSLASALLLPDRTRETVLLEFPSSRNRFPSIVLVMPKDCFFQDSP